MEPAAQIPLLMSSGSTSHCSPDLRVATMARTVELTASGSPRNVRASTRCKNPLRTAGESVTSWTPARAPGVIPQSPHTLPSPRGRPWALVLKPLFPETMHADTAGPPWEQDPQHSGRARESRLTVADPAPRRALSSEQSELGLQGPSLHRGAVQPLQGLHKHFEEERREASVLGCAALEVGEARLRQGQTPRTHPPHSAPPSTARARV